MTAPLTGFARVVDVVARYGTPTYTYRLEHVRRSCAALRAALPTPSALYYSVKANPHPDVVAEALRQGCHAEVSSTGELDAALAAGASPSLCLYTGPGKTAAELRHALARGVRRFSAESAAGVADLDRLASEAGVPVRCLLRVNAGHGAGAGLRMTGRPSQFGIDLAELERGPERLLGRRWARVVGLHFFPVSGASDEQALFEGFAAGVTAAARLRERHGVPLEELDVGGGFGAPYARPGGNTAHGPGLRARLADLFDEHLPSWRAGSPRVSFESGRYLVAGAGTLLVTVIDVKQSGGRVFVVVDAGIHHLGGMSGLGRLLPLAAAPELVSRDGGAPEDAPVDLVGPLCTPADVLCRGARLPVLRPGDVLAIPNVGAYGLTASLVAFLSRPAPAEVVLDEDELVSATALVLDRRPAATTGTSR